MRAPAAVARPALGIVARPGPRVPLRIRHETPWEGRIDAAVSDELEHIWSRVQAQLALVVDEPTYRIWLAKLEPLEVIGECLVLAAPPQSCRWIRGRFGRVIEASVELVLGPHATIELRPAEAAAPRARRGDRGAAPP